MTTNLAGESVDLRKRLRLRVALNCFKKLLIDEEHIAGQAQPTAVFAKLPTSDEKTTLAERTWENWFSDSAVTMRPGKAKVLDKLAAERIIVTGQDGGQDERLPDNFFGELIHGGLVQQMLSPTKAKQVRQMLMARAQEYIPISPLHLHLDAIEVNTITAGFHDVPWYDVTKIAANRIYELLYTLWGPRSGSIYSSLSSPLKLRWETANDNERKKIREWYARLKPDLFEEEFHPGAYPNWDQIGVGSDVAFQHIYKALFAMAADSGFLVADRLDLWTFDLATSALAMHALAWTDRYSTFGFSITDEMLFWSAFDHVLFDQEAGEVDDWYLLPAMKCCAAEWDEKALSVFTAARNIYQDELSKYDISTNDVMKIVEMASTAHPLIYYGDYDSNKLSQVQGCTTK